jgi:DNA-nicking Smr family endonuclease
MNWAVLAMAKQTDHPAISNEDAELFREAIGEVIIHRHTESRLSKAKPKPRARMFERDELEALAQSKRANSLDAAAFGQEPLLFQGPKVDARLMRKLKSGTFRVDAEFDLHGMSALEAERWLKQFLADAYRENLHCIRIIHGKGVRSEAGPVLMNVVDKVLRHQGRVLAYCSAPANQGGSGAALVLLGPG